MSIIKLKKRRGLTLVELLIAMTIASIVLVLVSGLFIQGLRDTKSLSDYSYQQERVNRVVGYLRQDIEAATDVKVVGTDPATNILKLKINNVIKEWCFENGELKYNLDGAGYVGIVSDLDTANSGIEYNSSEYKLVVTIKPNQSNNVTNKNRNEKKITAEFSIRYKGDTI